MPRPSKNYTARELIEGRHWACILYEDSSDYDVDLLLNRLPSFWRNFWYVKHDSDRYTESDFDKYVIEHDGSAPDWKAGDLKKVHYHVYGSTGGSKCSPCVLGRAAINFGVPSHMVQPIKNLNKAVQYLIHLNQPDKFQYSPDEIITNDESVSKRLKKVDSTTDKAKLLCEYIFSGDCLSLASLTTYALDNNLWDELRRGQHLYTALLNERKAR